MSGLGLVVAFVIAVIVMILAISKLKIHPFLSITGVSVFLGLAAGIPLVSRTAADGTVIPGLADVVSAGFSGTFTSIGIVIIFGALIGAILEATGAAFRLADVVINLVGRNRPALAIELMGWVVSVAVFCDSGFVILNPIRKALVRRTHTSSVAMTVALSAGLYASHVLIPPASGPMAAANALGIGSNMLLVMGMGVLISIPGLIGVYFYARYIGGKVKSAEDLDFDETQKTYEQIIAEYGSLPGGFISASPIIMPIILMAIGSIASMGKWTGIPLGICSFLGTPIVALGVGVLFGVWQLARTGTLGRFYDLTNETLKTVGPILFITAAGGVLGKVISVSGMVDYITAHSSVLQTIGIFFPFLLSAILKSAQGSSTVALTTTAGILAPMTQALGLSSSPAVEALTVSAIGAGAMIVSHANDSYFWIVTNLGGMTPQQGYKTHTMVTLVEGLCSMTGVFILWLFLR